MLSQALGSLELDGMFTLANNNYTANGPVEIGYAPTAGESFTALSVWDGNLSFPTNGTAFTFNGTIEGIEPSSNISIASITSSQTFSVDSLTSSPGVTIGGGNPIGVLGANLTPTSIALIDPDGGDTTDSFVSLQGNLSFPQLAGLSVPVSGTSYAEISPESNTPGLTLAAATAASNFQAFSVDFSNVSLSAGYSTAGSGEFQFSGSLNLSTSSGDFSAAGSLGTTSSPGLVVASNGSVTGLSVTLSGNISTFGLDIDADNLALNYNTSSVDDEYAIESGNISASTSSGDFSFLGSFGSGAEPGVVIENGSLSSLDATLNGSATASGLTMTASNDVLEFDAATANTPAEFEIADGNITVGSSNTSVSFEGTFGAANSPGVVLQGGNLTSLDITVTSNLTVAGLTLTANGVNFSYCGTDAEFQIPSGNVAVSGNGFSCNGAFGSGTGSNATPGIVMNGSNLTGLDITVSGNMALDNLNLTAAGLQFLYENDANSIYNNDFVINQGNVTISTSANDTYFEAQFGNSTSTPPTPGLVIAPDGSLSSLYATVSSNISAQNLTINATNLTFESYGNNGTFEILNGNVCMSSGPLQFASAVFGCSAYSEPGLEIANGTLTQLNIKINSNMSVEDMTLNISNLELVYEQVPNQTDGLFQIASGGSVNLSTGAANNTLTFNGTFGSPSNASLPGLCISDGQLQSFDIGVFNQHQPRRLAGPEHHESDVFL